MYSMLFRTEQFTIYIKFLTTLYSIGQKFVCPLESFIHKKCNYDNSSFKFSHYRFNFFFLIFKNFPHLYYDIETIYFYLCKFSFQHFSKSRIFDTKMPQFRYPSCCLKRTFFLFSNLFAFLGAYHPFIYKIHSPLMNRNLIQTFELQ